MKNTAFRDIAEIVKAHDILDGVLRHDCGLDLDIPEEELEKMRYQRDVLCWILKHPDRDAFQNNMDSLLQRAKELGFELKFKEH